MARNLKRDYLKKLAGIETANGYKVDLANYVYNPNLMYEYPALKKVISETDDTLTLSTVYYFKYYNGGGEYIHQIHTEPKESTNTWFVVRNKEEQTLEEANRFNLNKLIQYAENI